MGLGITYVAVFLASFPRGGCTEDGAPSLMRMLGGESGLETRDEQAEWW